MDIIFYISLIFLGLAVGSFMSAYTYRWPKGESVSEGRSFCDNCKKQISWYDNVPLLSYLLLGGKCRHCRRRISLRYPLIELSTAVLFVLTVSLLGGFGKLGFLFTTYHLLLTTILIAIFVIDLEHQLIPDNLVFLLIFISFAAHLLGTNDRLYLFLLSGFGASLFLLLLNLATRGRGMGLGDVKLAIPLGFILGWPDSAIWLSTSFIVGAIVGLVLIFLGKAKFGKHIAFGPFLIVAFLVTRVWGDKLIDFLLPYLR